MKEKNISANNQPDRWLDDSYRETLNWVFETGEMVEKEATKRLKW